MTTTPLPTPHVRRAAAALTKAVADDLYATSSTGDVYDVVVKCDNESWRENAERIGAIAAENIRPALAASLDVEEMARVAYREGAWCGVCEYDGWDACAECRETVRGYARAIRAEILGVDQ